jgi:hypothetical protein
MKNKRMASKDLNKLVTTFTIFKFIKDITTPFEEMEWFEKGFIDNKGEYLKDNKDIPPYYHLIINLKKLLSKIPDPLIKSKLKNMTTAISLFAEEAEHIGGNKEEIYEYIMNYLDEEMTTAAGISGVSPNPENEQNLPDTFMSKSAQRNYVKDATKKILRRRKNAN